MYNFNLKMKLWWKLIVVFLCIGSTSCTDESLLMRRMRTTDSTLRNETLTNLQSILKGNVKDSVKPIINRISSFQENLENRLDQVLLIQKQLETRLDQVVQLIESRNMNECSERVKKWTTFQRRGITETSPVRENFRRNWTEYSNGFGYSKSDFWLGLNCLHQMTNGCPHELLVELTHLNGSRYKMYYSKFLVADSSNKFRLTLAGFEKYKSAPEVDDTFSPVNSGQYFSTYDSDNDTWGNSCANYKNEGNGGWWYPACGFVRLNNDYPPEYIEGKVPPRGKIGIIWSNKGSDMPCKRVEMKMRPNC